MSMNLQTSYIRAIDGALMIEYEPGLFVNRDSVIGKMLWR